MKYYYFRTYKFKQIKSIKMEFTFINESDYYHDYKNNNLYHVRHLLIYIGLQM